MFKKNTTENSSENRPPVSYLVALNDKLQYNADKVERNIIETQQNLKRDIRTINEGRLPLYQRDINKAILDSIELLNSLDVDAAEAVRLQHPQSVMIEEDIKQLRERAMKLHEEHDRIYNCTTTFNWEKTDEKLDDSDWEVKRPSEVTKDAITKYSISSTAGQHECSETGLRWQSSSDVNLEYKFVEWKSLSKDIIKNYKPCGPLMDISVTTGTLREIQLPHFVCVDSESSSEVTVEVLHVKDGTVSLEKCELSGSHAKLLNPTFSFLAIVVKVQEYIKMKFHCETLIYRNRISPLNLHVYLILKDKQLKKDVEEKERKNMEILKPTPNEPFKLDDCYTLKTSCDSKIKPTSLKVIPGKTNFFDLHIKDDVECVELSIETKDGQKIWDVNIESEEFKMTSTAVNRTELMLQWWRHLIEVMGHSAQTHFKIPLLPPGNDLMRLRPGHSLQWRISGPKGAEFVEKHRAELIRKVSLVEPIADDMKDLIGEEKYRIVLNSATKEGKMRALLDFLTTPKLKEKLYQSLVKHERYVVDHLGQIQPVL
ncbi:hypothetical protein Q8A67_002832 [Cirrhinus molitorella]|uniref:FIIND domain-containing protein n=1 Tax=Cirrhinus molitorella TaxID=172907 RepID=A0AA88QEC2_9TELE|nr:hypothetical protein Q8A67_002832 [Cirrhinus molitorella]